VLKCAECRRRSFHSLDSLGQNYRCPRCDASNQLTAATWYTGSPEPTWVYDLHENLRDLINGDGDLPLLASRELHKTADRKHTYGDCPELEIRRNGAAVAEFDLLAHFDDRVAIVEAKRAGVLGKTAAERNATVVKLTLAARLLKADEVWLAAAAKTWNNTDRERVRSALRSDCPHSVEVKTFVGLAPTALSQI